MTPATTITRRFNRLPVAHSATHLFALGQAVRLRDALRSADNIYLITARLPPSGDSPQYRIRNDSEMFDRMATQVSLEPVRPAADGAGDSLIEKSFALSPAA